MCRRDAIRHTRTIAMHVSLIHNQYLTCNPIWDATTMGDTIVTRSRAKRGTVPAATSAAGSWLGEHATLVRQSRLQRRSRVSERMWLKNHTHVQ